MVVKKIIALNYAEMTLFLGLNVLKSILINLNLETLRHLKNIENEHVNQYYNEFFACSFPI